MSDTSLLIAREKSSLRELVVESIRNQILDGGLAPSQKLVERELCEQLGVSRAVLREALQQLQAEGLIVNILHRGPSVASISPKEAGDIYETRSALEAQAGRGFVRNAADEDLSTLESSVDALREAAAEHDPGAQLRAKNQFYATLIEGCGNSTIGEMLTLLNNRITLLRRLSLARPGRLAESIHELDEIVEAIRARDEDLVDRLLRQHVSKAAAIALESFASEDAEVTS